VLWLGSEVEAGEGGGNVDVEEAGAGAVETASGSIAYTAAETGIKGAPLNDRGNESSGYDRSPSRLISINRRIFEKE